VKLITTIGVTIFHRQTLQSPSLHATKCRNRNAVVFSPVSNAMSHAY
jgi:hypothetical protein